MQNSVPFPHSPERARATRPARRWRRWMFIPLILIVVAAIGVWRLNASSAATTAPTTTTVSQGSSDAQRQRQRLGGRRPAPSMCLFQQAADDHVGGCKGRRPVTAGQTLAQIDDADLRLALQQAQANLKSAQANLDQANNGSATPQDLASAQASLDSAEAQLTQTKNGTATKPDIQSAHGPACIGPGAASMP